MREIVLDTETTGLDAAAGDRIVELACLELLNHLPTGRRFHSYVNPMRAVSDAAYQVHGLSAQFLESHPGFDAIAEEFVAFIGDAPLVIHNAEFDLAFLNAEFLRLERPPLPTQRAIDTVEIARRKFPGAPASLDALCRRFGIDVSERSRHSALLDAELLAAVYLELIGGRQGGFDLPGLGAGRAAAPATAARVPGAVRPARRHAPTEAEAAAHDELVARLVDPLWRR